METVKQEEVQEVKAEEVKETVSDFSYSFKAVRAAGKMWTVDGDKEVMSDRYQKAGNYTDAEVQVILSDLAGVTTELHRIKNIINLIGK